MSRKPTYEELEQRVSELSHQITEADTVRKDLLESERRYRQLFETMEKGVVYQASDGKIISANPAAEHMLGLTLDQMMGRTSVDPQWKCLREDGSDFPGDEHPAMVALRTGRPVLKTLMGVFHPKENRHRWIYVDATPQFHPGEDRPYQVFATFSDVTDRKEAEEL